MFKLLPYIARSIRPAIFYKGTRKQYSIISNISTRFHQQIISPNISQLRKTLLALSLLGWLGFIDDDEEKESELIMTLKRAVLCTRREQYDKAEQLLHLALRIAQLEQNQQGILYCYDLMANLALEKRELDKAEKLFVSVMQMLLSKGVVEDNIMMIHISLKMARIFHLRAEESKAEQGYQWCLDKISKHVSTDPDAKILYGVINDWYAQFLLDSGKVTEAIKHLKEAYLSCCEVQGSKAEESMLLLNDLGIASWRADDLETATQYLTQAKIIGDQLQEISEHVGVIHANLGLLYLEKGLVDTAKKFCKEGFNLGKKHENEESIQQSNYCFEQIEYMTSKKQKAES